MKAAALPFAASCALRRFCRYLASARPLSATLCSNALDQRLTCGSGPCQAAQSTSLPARSLRRLRASSRTTSDGSCTLIVSAIKILPTLRPTQNVSWINSNKKKNKRRNTRRRNTETESCRTSGRPLPPLVDLGARRAALPTMPSGSAAFRECTSAGTTARTRLQAAQMPIVGADQRTSQASRLTVGRPKILFAS